MRKEPGVTSKAIPEKLNILDRRKPGNEGKMLMSKTSHVSGSSEGSDSAARECNGRYLQQGHSHHGSNDSVPGGQDKHCYQSSTGEWDSLRDHPTPPASYEYPRVDDWLRSCKGDARRGFDMHVEDCTALIDVLVTNGYHRVDNVLQRLEPRTLLDLADHMGMKISIGFAARVMMNVEDEVKRVNRRL